MATKAGKLTAPRAKQDHLHSALENLEEFNNYDGCVGNVMFSFVALGVIGFSNGREERTRNHCSKH